MDVLSRLQPLIGLVGILWLAYALSTNRRAISLRIVGWGLALQVLFALIVLKTDAGIRAFQWLGNKIQDLLHYSVEGSRFVFGPRWRVPRGFFYPLCSGCVAWVAGDATGHALIENRGTSPAATGQMTYLCLHRS